ncbi:MAG TPA: hypothetical protein VIL33_01205 [Rhodothermia bacterium]
MLQFSIPARFAVVALVSMMLLIGCDDDSTVVAPYLGSRPLTILRVTQSSQPDIQWVGGRVAAVGVNRGSKPALDETLIWLATAAENTLDSPLRVGTHTDAARIISFGGTPVDSLDNNGVYTVWVAEADAFAAALDTTRIDPFALADSTVTLTYILRGRSSGDPNLDARFTVTRDQSLLQEVYTITWAPQDLAFRRLAINVGSGGSFSNHIWHVVVPDGQPDSILPPVTVGVPPPGTVEVQEWEGFGPANHVLWVHTSDWDGESFGLRTKGYAQFVIFANNFE